MGLKKLVKGTITPVKRKVIYATPDKVPFTSGRGPFTPMEAAPSPDKRDNALKKVPRLIVLSVNGKRSNIL